MQYNDEYFYNKLEFDVMISSLCQNALLPEAKKMFQNMLPYTNICEIREELAKVNEARTIITRFERAPIYLSKPYLSLLDITIKGGTLQGIDLYETVYLFSTIRANNRLLESLIKNHEACSNYEKSVSSLYLDLETEQIFRKSLDESGEVLDEATPELKSIRNKLRGIDARIHQTLTDIIRASEKYLSDTLIVLRDDRYCLCVKAEYKNSFRGILHDTSSSNLTCYMEPEQIALLQAEKDKLKNLEKEEVERILRSLSVLQSSTDATLRNNYQILLEIDRIFTKAMLAITYDGHMPNVNEKGIFNLINARHPLLKVKKVIPNTITFGNKYYGIIITGPNTGGKTVLLKTIGLLSLMVKFGLLLPCDDNSNIMIYDHIYCDIGDDQSIQENLSTFSSHMKKIVAITNQVTPHSLALFDEIGSGTDPVEGAQIAIAVLKYFLDHKVNFITTTHYADLKAFAYEDNRIVNASMEFNKDTLTPTYHLIIGKSGSSNALQIAKNLGLKQEIIDKADIVAQSKSESVRSIIQNIEKKSEELNEKSLALDNLIKKNEELKSSYEKKMSSFEKNKERLLKEALEKADEKVQKKLDEVEKVIEEIKSLQNKGLKMHEVIEAQRKIDDAGSKILLNERKKKTKNKKEVVELSVGDSVYVEEYGQYGEIIRCKKGNSYIVQMGNLTMTLDKDDLTFVSHKNLSNKENLEVSSISFESTSSSSKKVSLSLDLRGMRYLDAKEEIEKYIDDLLVHHINSATIIHGFGTGALRELVLDICKKNKFIKEYRYGGEGEGGLGVTVITLND